MLRLDPDLDCPYLGLSPRHPLRRDDGMGIRLHTFFATPPVPSDPTLPDRCHAAPRIRHDLLRGPGHGNRRKTEWQH